MRNKNETIIIQRLFAYLIVLKYTQLIKTFNTDSVIAEFAYDPFGRRISKTVQGEKEFEEDDHNKEQDKDCDKDDDNNNAIKTTYYVYDNQDILMEYDQHGKVKARYVHGSGIDEHLAVEQKGYVYYYHADGLGSIVALTDSKQKVVQTYEYDSFGNMKQQGNKVKQPYTYTGREYDFEIGLYYYRARYYDAGLGRFISKDSIGLGGRDVNLYRYVGNNPINSIDPFGLKAINGMDCQEINRTQIPIISSDTPYQTYVSSWYWICKDMVIEDSLTCVCTCEKYEKSMNFYKAYATYEVTYRCCRKNKFVTMKKTETEQLSDDIRYSERATGIVRNILGTTTAAFGGCSCALGGVGTRCAY